MDDFETEFREKVLEALSLEDLDQDEITRETVLFKGGLGLDSIDAIELVIMIEKEYGVVLTVPERNQTVFQNFGVLCDFVRANVNRDKQVRQAV
jgi:acyl carrier protein